MIWQFSFPEARIFIKFIEIWQIYFDNSDANLNPLVL